MNSGEICLKINKEQEMIVRSSQCHSSRTVEQGSPVQFYSQFTIRSICNHGNVELTFSVSLEVNGYELNKRLFNLDLEVIPRLKEFLLLFLFVNKVYWC